MISKYMCYIYIYIMYMPSYDALWGYRCTYDSQTSGCVCMENMTTMKLIKRHIFS